VSRVPIEPIEENGRLLVLIIGHATRPAATSFVTPEDAGQQVGFVVYPAGGEVRRHSHLPLEREIVGTSEVIIVRDGRCEIDIYGTGEQLVATRELVSGDVAVICDGGHGFRFLEDTVLLEVKQGPYLGLDEKRYF
jgi:hypothetical protein